MADVDSNSNDQLPNDNQVTGHGNQVTADGKLVGKQYDLSDIKKSCSKWSADADLGLLNYLREISQRLVSRTHEVESLVSGVVQNVKGVDCQVNNVINEFLMLSNDHFIENRVYDDELRSDENDSKQPNESNVEDKAREVDSIPCIKEALRNGLAVLDEAYDLVKTAVDDTISDSDSDGDVDKSLPAGYNEPVLEPKDKYVDRPLPVIIGTTAFLQRDDVGLIEEEDEIEEVATDVGSVSSTSNVESENEDSDKVAEENSEDDESDDDRPRRRPQRQRTFTSSEEEDEDDLFAAPKKAVKRSDNESDESESVSEVDQVQEDKPKSGITAELNKKLRRKTVDSASDDTETVSEAVASDTSSIKRSRKSSKTSVRKVVADDDIFQENDDDDDGPFGSKGALFNTRKSGLFDDDGGLFDDDVKKDESQVVENEIVNKENKKRNRTKSGRKIPAGGVAVLGTGDSELFGTTPVEEEIEKEQSKVESASVLETKSQKSVSKGLFDDDEDADELFAAAPTSIKKTKPTKKTLPAGSLFGDDDNDDTADDLFTAAVAKDENDKKKTPSKKKAPVGGVALPSAASIRNRVQRQSSSENESDNDKPKKDSESPKSSSIKTVDDTVAVAGAAAAAAIVTSKQSSVTRSKSGLFDSDSDDGGLFTVESTSKTSGNTSKSEDKPANKIPVGGVALFGASAIKSRRIPDSDEDDKNDDEDEDDFNVKGNPPKMLLSQPSKAKSNLGGLFDDDDDDDYDLFNSKSKSTVTDQKVENPGNQKVLNTNKSKVTVDKKATIAKETDLFDDEEDDGLFAATTPKPQPSTNKSTTTKIASNTSLFDDNEGEDDLFFAAGASESKSGSKSIKKQASAKVSKSDDKSSNSTESKDSQVDNSDSSAASPVKRKKIPAGARPMFGAAGMDILQKKTSVVEKEDVSRQKSQESIVSSSISDDVTVSEATVTSLDDPPAVKTLESVNKSRTKGQARRRPPSRRGVSSKSSTSSVSTPVSDKPIEEVFNSSQTVSIEAVDDSTTGSSVSTETKSLANIKTPTNKSSDIFNTGDLQDDVEDDLFASPVKADKEIKPKVGAISTEKNNINTSVGKEQKTKFDSNKKGQLFGDSFDDDVNTDLFISPEISSSASKASSASENIKTTDSSGVTAKKGRSDSKTKQDRVSSIFDNDDDDDIFGGLEKKKSLKGKAVADTVSQEPIKKEVVEGTRNEIGDDPLFTPKDTPPADKSSSSVSNLPDDNDKQVTKKNDSKDSKATVKNASPTLDAGIHGKADSGNTAEAPDESKGDKKPNTVIEAATRDEDLFTDKGIEKHDETSSADVQNRLSSESPANASLSDINNVSISTKETKEEKPKSVKKSSQLSSVFDDDDDIFGEFEKKKASKTKEATKSHKKEKGTVDSSNQSNTIENKNLESTIDSVDKTQLDKQETDANPIIEISAKSANVKSATKSTAKSSSRDGPSSIFDDDDDIFGDFERKKTTKQNVKAVKTENQSLVESDKSATAANQVGNDESNENANSGNRAHEVSSEKKSKSKPSDDIFADDLGIFDTPGAAKKSKKKTTANSQKGTEDSPKPKSSGTKKKGSKKVDKKSAKKYDIFDKDESSIFDDPLNAGGK